MTAQTSTVLKTYFNTGDKPTEAQFANLIDSFMCSDGSTANDYFTWTGSASVGGSSVAYVSLNAAGVSDTHIGIKQKSIGTNTTGQQFYGVSSSLTGKQYIQINGANAAEFTDDWWNPNVSYQGAPTAWPVFSSGALAGGPDNIAVIGCNSSIYPGTASGVTLMHCARGTTGAHHFTNNGVVAHVNIAAITNPNGNDTYCTAQSSIWFYGVATGDTGPAVITTQGGTANGTLFYDSGTGGYEFKSDNTVTPIVKLQRVASAVNQLVISPSATGFVPQVGVQGSDTNIGIALVSKGTGGIYIKGSGTNDSASAGYVGEYISSSIAAGSAVSLTTTVAANVTSISLTAGDWDVSGLVAYTGGGSYSLAEGAVNTTSATLPTAPDGGYARSASNGNSLSLVSFRLSLSATTTVYLITKATISGSVSAYGFIGARRRR